MEVGSIGPSLSVSHGWCVNVTRVRIPLGPPLCWSGTLKAHLKTLAKDHVGEAYVGCPVCPPAPAAQTPRPRLQAHGRHSHRPRHSEESQHLVSHRPARLPATSPWGACPAARPALPSWTGRWALGQPRLLGPWDSLCSSRSCRCGCGQLLSMAARCVPQSRPQMWVHQPVWGTPGCSSARTTSLGHPVMEG